LREHLADDAVGEHRIHHNRIRLGVQGRVMAALQLHQGSGVPPDDAPQQLGVSD